MAGRRGRLRAGLRRDQQLRLYAKSAASAFASMMRDIKTIAVSRSLTRAVVHRCKHRTHRLPRR